MAAKPTLICRTATTFAPDGSLDVAAQEEFLQRLVDCGLGMYLASAGSGEGHALDTGETRRLYEIGVSVGGGRVPVNANPPEAHTSRRSIEHAQLAAECGVDVVNVYGPTAWHGFRPTDDELMSYYDEVFAEFRYPTALAPNPIIGYTPSARVIAEICAKHHQVVAINLAGLNDYYFIQLQDALTRPVDVFVPFVSSLHTLSMGAAGLLGAEANILPETFRRYLSQYAANRIDELGETYAHLYRFSRYVQPWHSASPRWIKMSMAVLGLPGGRGGLRGPYRMPPAEELQRFADGLLSLGIPEITELLATSETVEG
jgi:dihydrodipicolinate synthase/N-acetylneuraminate lyase